MSDENSTENCQNCKHEIPSANFQMHMIHCRRNIQLCPQCQERILRSELENHTKEFHSMMKCNECESTFQRSDLDRHKKDVCTKRIVACQHCDLELKADDIDEHEDYCGSRTEHCEGCGKHIMLKFQHLHIDSDHKFVKLPEDNVDSDDEDLVMVAEGNRNCTSSNYKRKNNSQRQPFSNAGPSAKGYSSVDNHKQKRPKSKRYEETSELNEYFQNMDLENGRIPNGTTAEISELINREKKTSMNSNPTWLDETFIPCEFCKLPVVANDLVLHQTGCQPDLFSREPFEEESHETYVNVDNDDNDLQCMAPTLEHREDLIPCEFCLQLFSLDDIASHQYICRRNDYVV